MQKLSFSSSITETQQCGREELYTSWIVQFSQTVTGADKSPDSNAPDCTKDAEWLHLTTS